MQPNGTYVRYEQLQQGNYGVGGGDHDGDGDDVGDDGDNDGGDGDGDDDGDDGGDGLGACVQSSVLVEIRGKLAGLVPPRHLGHA